MLSAAAELKQEFKDKDNVVVQSVTAKLPEGAFQADISEVTMEVKHLKEDKDTYINDMIKEILPEYTYADNIVLFDIQFKVNGTITDPLKPVEITIEDKDINIEDKDKEKVFYFDPADPAVAGDKDELEGLTVKDCKTDKVTAEVSKSTIYGCYEEKLSKEKTYTTKVDGVEISVTAPEGAFDRDSEKVYMTAEDLTITKQREAKKLLEQNAEETGEELVGFKVYDINLWADEAHTEKIQPQIPVTVAFKNLNLDAEEADTLTPVRIDTEENTVTEVEGNATADNAKMEAEHFTEYGVMAKKKPGGTTWEEPGGTTTGEKVDFLEGYLNEDANEWQILSGGYPTGQKNTNDQALRIRKSVIPTNVENEFYMYLSIEPMMDWESVINMTSIWVCNSRNGIDNNITEEQAQSGQFGGASHYSKVCDSLEEAATEANNPTDCNKYWELTVTFNIYDANGNIRETITKDTPSYVYMQAGANWTELVRFPFDELYSKYESDFTATGKHTGTITLNITTEHLGGNYEFLDDKVIVDEVEDPIGDKGEGDYILYQGGLAQTSSSANYNSGEDKIFWNNFTEFTPSVDFTDYEKVQLSSGKYTYYRKSAYEMRYKIRLEVEI